MKRQAEEEARMIQYKKTQPDGVGFEDGGKGSRAKESGQAREAAKVKQTDSPLEPPKRNGPPTDTLMLAWRDPFWTLREL